MAKLYDLKLKPEILAKAKSLPKQIQLLKLFVTPINISIISTNANNDIMINKNLELDIGPLIAIKEKLNLYKIGIDTRNTEKWEEITRKLNISQGVIQNIKKYHQIDISRGFCKMYEIYQMFDLMVKIKTNIHTLHICEAPGHFINATYYYIKTFRPDLTHRWDANSLNPIHLTNPHALKDVYGFIKNYPNQWHWGPDDTGDITKKSTIEYFKSKFSESVDIFTSDCGLGAVTRFEYFNQEEMMSQINCAQIFIALITTKITGSAIFKLFIPFTKPNTISLVYILSKYFADVAMFKPTTGSPTNNEIYIVCNNKKMNLDETTYNTILDFITGGNFSSETYLAIPDSDFIDQLAHVSDIITETQIEHLRVIYDAYDNPHSIDENEIKNIKYQYYLKWCKYFKFDGITNNLLTSVTKFGKK